MRVGTQKEVSEDLKVRVQPFDAPLHWETIDRDHHALVFRESSILGGDVLIDTSYDASTAHVAAEDCFLCGARVPSTHDRCRPFPLKGLIEHVCSAVIHEHAIASLTLHQGESL